MTDQRWRELIERLEDEGKIVSRVTEDLEGKLGTVERAVVTTPLGRLRLSRTSEPKRLADRAFYSKRGGSTVSVQASYDESESVHVFTVERFAGASGTWARLDPGSLAL
jgi:hypothetical protein